ncbi:MAG: flagellar biosynthesis protein FlgD [Shinella sp.]|nr:MAG: flagellar biosynthesis protein FlgD [Shinella sp.]
MVTAVSSTTSTTASSSTTSSTSTKDAASASLDYDAFLKLLIAQMQNQDPTDPMDASEQISQLATFSQVEQSIKTNTNLETMIGQNSLASAASYVGKALESADGKTTGVVAYVSVTSDGMVATTTDGDEITIENGIIVGEPAS